MHWWNGGGRGEEVDEAVSSFLESKKRGKKAGPRISVLDWLKGNDVRKRLPREQLPEEDATLIKLKAMVARNQDNEYLRETIAALEQERRNK